MQNQENPTMDRKRQRAMQQIDQALDAFEEDNMSYTWRWVMPEECRELDIQDARNRARNLLSKLREMEMFEAAFAATAIWRLATHCKALAIIGNDKPTADSARKIADRFKRFARRR